MNKRKVIRKLLGFTQEEMAHLIGVGRSHYSMYETGRRDLPIGASVMIDQLTIGISLIKKHSPELPLLAPHREYLQSDLKRILGENQYQQQALTRKIETAEKKYSGLLKRMEILEILGEEHKKTGSPHKSYIDFIALKCSEKLKKEIVSELFHSRLKLMELQQCNALHTSELKKLYDAPSEDGNDTT